MRKKSLLFALLMALFMPWAANAQQSLPYSEGFEDYSSGLPTGWTKVGSGTVAVQTTASHVHQGSVSLKFSGATSNVVALPQFAKEINQLQISLYSKAEGNYGSCGYFDVGYVTDLTDASTFVQLQSDYYSSFTSYGLVGPVSMASAPNGAYIALRHRPTSTYYYWFVDDITVEMLPACPYPTNLQASGVTHEEATITWTSDKSAWQIVWSTDENFDPDAATPTSVTTKSYTINGLTAQTDYYVYVRSNCTASGDGYSDWSDKYHFKTTAQATAVGDSWSDDFEGTSCGWDLINGTLTNQWVWGTAVNNGGTHALYISNDGGNSNTYSADNTKVFAAKLLNFTEGKFIFSYDWRCKGESSWDFLRVALVPASQTLTAGTDYSTITQPSLPTGWIALDGGKLNLQETWQSVELAVNVPAGNYYLVLAWRNDSGVYDPPAAVDNMSITRMACPYDVTGLAVSNIATTTADIAWTNGDPGEWQVATKTGDGEWITLPNTYTTNSATLTGLTAATTYQVRVRAYCNANDQGAWCDAITFTTECEAIDLSLQDYSENFDSYTAGTGVLPVCWNRINEGTSYTTYPYIYGYNAHSTSNCLYFYTYGTSGSDQYAILPAMENMEGKQITLWAKGYNVGNTFKIGMMTDPADATTFEEIAEQTLTTSYEEYSFILGRGNYVAIMMETPTSSVTKGVYIDDITIADVPACAKPSDLTFVSATTTSATIGWTIGGNENAWQIAYSTDPAFDPDEVTPVDVTSNPGTIDGLTAATTYYAYVRANCGNNGYSDWSNAYCMFTTACEAISDLPWNENFDAYTGSTSSSAPTGYPNNEMPTCWQFLNRSDNSTTYPQVFISSNSGYPVSGNCLFFKSSSSTPLYAVLPEFEEDIAGLQLTFTYRNEGTTASNGTLIVGYMTNPADATTFTAVQTCEITTTLTEMEVPFTSAPAGSYMAFMYQGGSSNNYYLSIDNVSVDYIPTCAKPTDLTFVSATTTTATLSWTSGANETAWQIMLNDDEENLIMAENNQWVIEGLTASTAYTAKVRAYCSAVDQSDWSNEVSFTTACDVIVVDATHPLFENFDGITSGIPLCWDNSEGTTTDESYKWNYYATGQNGHCVRFNSYNNSENNTNFLKTPVMELPVEGVNLQLSFWYKNPTGGDFSVFISTDGGETYTTELASDLTDQSDWTNEVISLSEYAGNENVVIVFAGTSNWGYGDAYIYLDEVFVGMPYILNIAGVGEENWEGGNGGYYLIASPVTVDLSNHAMTSGDFDLYAFDQAEDDEWRNYKQNAFSLEPGKGYLYAHKVGGEFTLTGTPYTGNGTIELVYDDNATSFQGWNLVGNPWGVKAYPNQAFYTMAEGGAAIDVTPNVAGTEVDRMTGIFVVANGANQTVTFETEAPSKRNANLALNVTNSNKLVDRAIIRFGEGRQLPKFQLNPNHTKVYMPVDGKDYAIVNAESNMGEMPVSFKAESNGTYSLSFNAEEVNFSYLHLIDNMTGNDVDLLSNPCYSFEARTTDYASRFKLVFATGNASDDNFAFFSNGSFVINNEGNATVEVIDVTGRIISSETINGCANVNVNAANGVYMIRLVNGDNVKVQKVVVK